MHGYMLSPETSRMDARWIATSLEPPSIHTAYPPTWLTLTLEKLTWEQLRQCTAARVRVQLIGHL